jgi:hypothetical protein
MPGHIEREGSAVVPSPQASRRADEVRWPAVLPAPWVTHLTCPVCRTPDALLAFDGVGTVCAECGDATRVLTGDGSEDA